MQTADVTVRLKAQDGNWEVAGSDRYPRVVPESVSYTSNKAGSETCNFVLRRNPEDFHPDLTAFTPCEIEIGGVLVWRGRVKEAPTQEGPDTQIAVTGEGMQFHLDDDLYQRTYIQARVADFQDMRTMPTALLGNAGASALAAGQVSNDSGTIQLGTPKSTVITAGTFVGVVLDLGFNSKATNINVTWESSNNTSFWTLYARASDYPDSLSTATGGWNPTNYSDAFTVLMNAGGSGTSGGSFSTPHRYVQLFIYNNGFNGTTGADEWFKLKNIDVYTDPNYAGYGLPVLRASDVVRDAVSKGTKLLTVPDIASLPYQDEVMSTPGVGNAFPMDETSGTAATDLVTPGTPGTYTNVTLGQPGMLEGVNDSSVRFSKPSGSAMTAPIDAINPRSLSLEVVFNPAIFLPQTQGVIITNGTPSVLNNGVALQISNAAGTGSGSLLGFYIFGSTYINTGFTLSTNTVYHVIFTVYEPNGVLTYKVTVNGTVVYTGTPGLMATPSGSIVVGNTAAGNTSLGYNGDISFAASYTRALAANEETLHYQAALSRQAGTVQRTAFNIPEFRAGDITTPQTPREVTDAVNALHDYQLKVTEDQTVMFRPQPSVPLLEVGPWAGAKFQDASAGSGEDVYNRCVVTGTGPDGLPLWVDRYASQLLGSSQVTSNVQAVNPSFDTNTSGWTATASTITRDIGTFDTSPASGRWDNTGASDALGSSDSLETIFNGTFKAGSVYKLYFSIRATSPPTPIIGVRFGELTTADIGVVEAPMATVAPGLGVVPGNGQVVSNIPTSAFIPVTVTWAPKADTSAAKLRFDVVINTGSGYLRIDSLDVAQAASTVIDRRGFLRTKSLPTQTAINTVVGTQLANTFLAGHSTVPLKGSLSVIGSGGVRAVVGGDSIPAYALGPYTGELLRLSHLVDPDTGGLGRDGRIAAVSYSHATQTANISIDNQRGNFEAMIARLAVVTGVATQT